MQRNLLLVALALAPAALAQTVQLPLPAFNNTFASTTLTRGLYFQTPVDITITGLRVPDEGAAGVQCVEVSALAAAPPAFPGTASGGQVFYANNVPSSYIIPCSLSFAAGSWIGVIGACGTTTMNSSYAAPTGPFNTTIAGNPVTLARMGTQTNLNTGGGQPYWSENAGRIGRVEIYYNTPSLTTPTALPAFGSTFSSVSLTRGFSFQTPVPIIIRGLRVPDEFQDGTQNVEVKRLSAQPPVFPTTATGGEVFYANNVPSYQIIPCNLPFQAGDWIGVLGACGTSTMRNSYGTPTGPFASSIGGNPVTLTRMGTQTNLNTAGSQPYWTEVNAAVSRVEVYYELATGMAAATTYGLGCIRASRGFYELSSSAAFDLSGLAMTLVPSGGRYVVNSTGSYVAPTGAATNLVLSDDSDVLVNLASSFAFPGGSTSSFRVCSNGFVSVGSGNGTSFSVSSAAWFPGPVARWGDWHDFNPARAGSGLVKFEEVGNISYVTWDGVYDFSGPAVGNTWQLQFNRATGSVTYVWQTMSLGGNDHLVGFSPGAPTAANLGSMDISAQLVGGFETQTFDSLPLTFNASARPVIGTTIGLDTSNITPGSIFGATLLGLAPDATSLAGLGAPGCSRYVTPLATNVFLIGGPMASLPFVVPNNPYLMGLHVFGESATYSPGANPLNVLFSNGLDLLIDLL